MKENPYQFGENEWYWIDEKNIPYGPYPTESEALYAVLYHMATPWYIRWWVRRWNTLKEIWNDSRG